MLPFLFALALAAPEPPALDGEDVAIIRAVIADKDRGMIDFYRKESGGVCIAPETAPWSDVNTDQLRTMRDSQAQPADSLAGFAEALHASSPESLSIQSKRTVQPDLLPAADLDAKRKCTITLSVSTPRHFGRFAVASTDYRGHCWCGHGGVYLLERKDDRWQVIGELYDWIA